MDLIGIGWNSDRKTELDQLNDPTLAPARVVREDRNGYLVATRDGEARATLSRRARDAARSPGEAPAVGDWVALRAPEGAGAWIVHAVLPRRSKFSRAAAGGRSEEQVLAANVDVAFIVQGLDGDFNARRLERYVALVAGSGAAPVVVLNKADLARDLPARVAEAARAAPGADVLVVSAETGAGVDALRARAAGRTVVLLGSSGVGKSSLVNRLLGDAAMATHPVRELDSRGRHTTTARELLPLPGGGAVIDTPGMRELQLWGADGIAEAFAEVEGLARLCRFRDCRHATEPGCAVRAAIDSGDLDEARLASYAKLQREAAVAARKRSERGHAEERALARQWGKTIRSATRAKKARLDGWEP